MRAVELLRDSLTDAGGQMTGSGEEFSFLFNSSMDLGIGLPGDKVH